MSMVKRYTPEQEVELHDATSSALSGLAERWGLTVGALRAKQRQLRIRSGRYRPQSRAEMYRKPKPSKKSAMPVAAPFARPAWFDEDVGTLAQRMR